MEYFKSIVDTIGNTPLVKINNIIDTEALLLAKVESFNPGHSTKDRMALKMIEDAESQGLINKGGTIIEATSGNTGMGLALACIKKGYKLICTMSDKQSKEKVDILKAMGAQVHVCPAEQVLLKLWLKCLEASSQFDSSQTWPDISQFVLGASVMLVSSDVPPHP